MEGEGESRETCSQGSRKMDPAAHVAAFPLPPDYFFALLPEQIKTMAPPRAPSESCTVFGMPILVGSLTKVVVVLMVSSGMPGLSL